MKKCILLFIIISLLFITAVPASAAVSVYYHLDEIQNYTITVDPRTDGTLDMRFKIEWTVLDSTSEGPLEWVKIGIPNYHVDEITAVSGNIRDISYMSENGAYIRIDFDRAYYAGETLTFEFSTHQSYMYKYDGDITAFYYMPGWFDEIDVKQLRIYWNDKGVKNSDALSDEGGYLVWEEDLNAGERFKVNIVYDSAYFPSLDTGMQYTDASRPPMSRQAKTTLLSVLGVLALIIIIVIVIAIKAYDPYIHYRGFGGKGGDYHVEYGGTRVMYYPFVGGRGHVFRSVPPPPPPPSSGGGRIGGGRAGGGCACACACACAGGGRAGCSKKDFYGTNLKTDSIIKALKD